MQVRATMLDHGLPVLAFALEERAQINIWRNKVEAMGLAVGPWLRAFKEATLRGIDDATPIPVAWADARMERPVALPFGLLKKEIMKITSGRKIVYVVDCAFTDGNRERILRLAEGADILFIEGGFLNKDAAAASMRRHLTARQAGTIARTRSRKAARDASLFASLQRARLPACARSSERVSEWVSARCRRCLPHLLCQC